MKKKLLQKIFSKLIVFSLIVNLVLSNLLPYTAYAQEVILDPNVSAPDPNFVDPNFQPTSAPLAPTLPEEIQQTPIPTGNIPDSTSIPTPTLIQNPISETTTPAENQSVAPSETPTTSPTPTVIPTVTPEASPEITPQTNEIPSENVSSDNASLDAVIDLTTSPVAAPSANSLWSSLGEEIWGTTENIELNKEYAAPQNDKVKIVFTKLPESSGKLTIKEVKLTQEQIEQTKALSDTAYDITSTMQDGTFEYDLTLPLPENVESNEVEIKSAEDVDQLDSAQKVEEPKEEKSPDTITIKGLNHFTVFVITAPDPDTTQKVLINEVVPTAGTEWIELFNNSTASINLANGTGWTIRNSANNSLSLSSLGAIAPAGRVVFEPTPNWLSDTAPENITLSNELGTTVDTITISLTAPGFAINHYPLANESVGRKTDGVSEWRIFTSPTKGTANAMPLPAGGLADVSEINPDNGYPTWYKDSAGIALQLCLAGANGLADGNCTLPSAGEEENFDPANPVSFPDNFPGEAFWYLAEPDVVTNAGQTGQGRVRFRYALESAFTTEAPTAKEQIAFLRINLQPISDLVPGADYIVTHPFGEFTIHADETGVADEGRFFRVEDGAFAPPLTRDTAASILPATNTHISKFLKQVSPVPPTGYIGDGSTLSTIEEGPNGNFVRVEGPSIDVNNYDGDGNPNSLTINTWTVAGKLAGSTAPVITLFGANPVNVNQNSTYIDAGATALDDADGNLTGSIVVTGLPVDTSALGAKTITYTVSDNVSNTTVVTRTVNVVESPIADAIAPVITILGANPASVVAGTPYVDAGATALDNVDGDLTAGIITTGLPVDTSIVGAHTVTYNVSDAAGNPAITATRTVNVTADITAPVISITGSNPVHVFTGQAYTDAGATAIDNVDGNLTAGIIATGLPIDTSVAGTHAVIYSVTDSSENTANAVRTVIVADVLPAGLVETGPVSPITGFFPSWYKDSNGLALGLCLDQNGMCLLENPDAEAPISFPDNFGPEAFWWNAETAFDNGTQDGLLVLALEAAFDPEVIVDGNQVSFGRIRVRIGGLTIGAEYTVDHPFGTDTFIAEDDGTGTNTGEINSTSDIGLAPGGVFTGALSSDIGPFLTWPDFQTDPALLVDDGNGVLVRYVGNPGIDHVITGSPVGQNFFRVTGPDIDQTVNLFSVSGRLADVTAPVITILGANPASVTVGTVYTDAGATALDNVDGDITANIVTTGLPIDTSAVGTFTVTYTVTDAVGNITTVARAVNVEVPAPVVPVLTTINITPVAPTINVGATQAFTAATLDQFGNPIAATVTWTSSNAAAGIIGLLTGSFSALSEGITIITATSGTVSASTVVTVNTVVVVPPPAEVDIVAPVITILGANPANVNVGEVYIDAGATALDNVDGNLTASIVTTGLPVDTSVVGAHTVTYNVSDAAGNAAITATRTVNVVVVVPVPTPTPISVGSITIIENVIPNDAQDFGFRLRNSILDERFSLDDDGDISNDLSNTSVFLNLAPGLYSLDQDSASNWILDIVCEDADSGTTVDINARKASIDLDSGENITCTFVNSLKGSITGSAFNDINTNGIQDAGEIGLSGWTIFSDTNDNGILDSGEVSATTDANGNYQFLDFAGGTYNIAEVLQDKWEQTAPTGGKHVLVVTSNNSFINQDFGNILFLSIGSLGRFVSTSGSSLTLSVISQGISTLAISSNGGTSSIVIPDGTVISRVDGTSFNVEDLSISVPLESSLAGLGENTVVDGVLQWGIPSVGLQFSSPITLSIFVGNSLNGQTLDVRRSIAGTSDWTTDGIVTPTCTVTDGLCTFQATKASFYAATHSLPEPTPTPAPAATSSDTSSATTTSTNNNDTAASAPVCNDTKPGSAPTLLSVLNSGAGEVTLTWSKALDPVTYYLVAYGTVPGQLEFGNPNVGGADATTYTISGLSDLTNYYFKVRAGNGCMPGDFSDEVGIGAILASNAISDITENGLSTQVTEDNKTKTLGATDEEETQIKGGIKLDRKFIANSAVIVAITLLILSFLALNNGSFYRKLRKY